MYACGLGRSPPEIFFAICFAVCWQLWLPMWQRTTSICWEGRGRIPSMYVHPNFVESLLVSQMVSCGRHVCCAGRGWWTSKRNSTTSSIPMLICAATISLPNYLKSLICRLPVVDDCENLCCAAVTVRVTHTGEYPAEWFCFQNQMIPFWDNFIPYIPTFACAKEINMFRGGRCIR